MVKCPKCRGCGMVRTGPFGQLIDYCSLCFGTGETDVVVAITYRLEQSGGTAAD